MSDTDSRNKAVVYLFWIVLLAIFTGCHDTLERDTDKSSIMIQTETLPLVTKSCVNGDMIDPQNGYVSSSGTISTLLDSYYPHFIHNLKGGLVNSPLDITDINIESLISISGAGFSPNGEWLALGSGNLYEDIPQKIHLLHHSGEIITTEPENLFATDLAKQSGSWAQRFWVNDELLLVNIVAADEENNPHIVKRLLNPFTGEWYEEPFTQLHRQDNGAILFSPDMTKVLYVNRGTDAAPHVELWDLVNQKALWQNQENMLDTSFFSSDDAWSGSAAWSPDSAWVAFTYIVTKGQRDESEFFLPLRAQDVYLLDREGKESRLITNFFSIYNTEFRTHAFSWSPNGRFLAMALHIITETPEVPAGYRLYLYDIMDNHLMDICWMQGSSPGIDSPNRALIWSPDGKFIAYDSSIDSEGTPPMLNIVDIEMREFVQVESEYISLGGWSAYSFVSP